MPTLRITSFATAALALAFLLSPFLTVNAQESVSVDVVTSDPLLVAETYAMFAGQINTKGVNRPYWFEYGTSISTMINRTATKYISSTSLYPVYTSQYNLNPGTTYYYRLVSESIVCDLPGFITCLPQTSYGLPKSFTTDAPVLTQPSAPSNLTAQSNPGYINLRWQDNSNDEDQFWIRRGDSTTNITESLGFVLADITSFQDTTAVPGVRYCYNVTAQKFGLDAPVAVSNTVCATATIFGGTPPATPSNLTVTDRDTQDDVRWQDNSNDENGFYLERQYNGGTWQRISTLGANAEYSTNQQMNASEHCYRVQAFNDSGVSGYSNVACTNPNAVSCDFFHAVPSTVTAGEQTTLAWGSSNAVAGYITGIGPVAANGSVAVSPSASTWYTLVLSGEQGGSVSCNTEVIVPEPVPKGTFVVQIEVNNDDGGGFLPTDFNPYITTGTGTKMYLTHNTPILVDVGMYTVTQHEPGYVTTYGGDCDTFGQANVDGDEETICLIINNDLPHGCTDVTSPNYDPEAVFDDGSCLDEPPAPLPQCSDGIDNDGDGLTDNVDSSCLAGYEFEVFDNILNLQLRSKQQSDQFLVEIQKLEDARLHYKNDAQKQVIGLIVGVLANIFVSDELTKALSEKFGKYFNELITDKIVDEYSDILVDQLPEVQAAFIELMKSKQDLGVRLTHSVIMELMATIANEVGGLTNDEVDSIQTSLSNYLSGNETYYQKELSRSALLEYLIDTRVTELFETYDTTAAYSDTEHLFAGDLQRRLSGNSVMLTYITTKSNTMDVYAELDGSEELFWRRLAGDGLGIALSYAIPGLASYIGPASVIKKLEKIGIDYVLWSAATAMLKEGGADTGTTQFAEDIGGAIVRNTLNGFARVSEQKNNGQTTAGSMFNIQKVTVEDEPYLIVDVENTGLINAELKLMVTTQVNIPFVWISWLPSYQWRLPMTRVYEPDAKWTAVDVGNTTRFFVPLPDDVWRLVDPDDHTTIQLMGQMEDEIRLLQSTIIDNSELTEASFELLAVKINSPGELRLVDSDGRVTGLREGQVVEEIPHSYYDPEKHGVVVYNDIGEYEYEIHGTDTGTYGLTIEKVSRNMDQHVSLTDIGVNDSVVHSLRVDWENLTESSGVVLQVSKNTDVTESTEIEFGTHYTDTTSPVSNVVLGDDFVTDKIAVTPVSIVLSAQDGDDVGVQKIEYSFDGENWFEYTGTTTITDEGEYTVYYRSTDWFGNVEETKSVTFEIVSAQGLIEETFAWVEIQDDKKLKSLEQMLKNALDEKFWEDRNTLKKAGAQSVFSHLKNALKFIGETESDRTERLNLALEILNKTE